MQTDPDFEGRVLRIATAKGKEPVFYRDFNSIQPPDSVGSWWLHDVKRTLIANGFIVHENTQRASLRDCGCDSFRTHFHRRGVTPLQQETLRLTPDSEGSLLRTALGELRELYKQFPLELAIWKRDGPRRDPYRTLIVMGLSHMIRDRQGLPVWRDFLARYPTAKDLRRAWQQHKDMVLPAVRSLGQADSRRQIIEAAIEFGDEIPSDTKLLIAKRGIGELTAEKIRGYGFGKPALPLDSQGQRVISRILGGRSKEATYFRAKLKRTFPEEAWMEVHEVLRLHGQVICAESQPVCSDCPITRCDRKTVKWSGAVNRSKLRATETIELWQEWRQLLLRS